MIRRNSFHLPKHFLLAIVLGSLLAISSMFFSHNFIFELMSTNTQAQALPISTLLGAFIGTIVASLIEFSGN